jgi:hypothetical protein
LIEQLPALESENEDIGALVIDPAAEPITPVPSSITAQQENDFYKQTGTKFHLLHNQQNLGVLGKFFGSNSSAPTNIAGFVIICSFVVIVGSLFVSGNSELVESRKWFIGLITSAMSFIFGAASKK